MRSPIRGFLTGFRVHVRNRGNFTGVRVQIPPRPRETQATPVLLRGPGSPRYIPRGATPGPPALRGRPPPDPSGFYRDGVVSLCPRGRPPAPRREALRASRTFRGFTRSRGCRFTDLPGFTRSSAGAVSLCPGSVPAYKRWHANEHIPERMAVPGFLRARRYSNASAARQRYCVLYD